MGDVKKAYKKAKKAVSNTVNNIGREVGKAVNNTGRAVGNAVNDAGRVIDNTGDELAKQGNKLGNGISRASTDLYREGIRPAMDKWTQMASVGALSTDGKSGWLQGNSVGNALLETTFAPEAMELVGDAFAGNKNDLAEEAEGVADMAAPDGATLDPTLEDELSKARRRRRASTVLAGASDSGSSGSARRTLYGY